MATGTSPSSSSPRSALDPSCVTPGPATQQLMETRPIMINRHVFLLPSRKSDHLEQFLSKLPSPAVGVSDVIEGPFDAAGTCVVGCARWNARDIRDDGSGTVVVSLKSLSFQQEIKVYLTGTMVEHFPENLSGNHLYMYVYGAVARDNPNYDPQSQVCCRELLVLDGRNHRSCLIIVHKWLYTRMACRKNCNIIDGLPNPVTGKMMSLSSPSMTTQQAQCSGEQVASSNMGEPRVEVTADSSPQLQDGSSVLAKGKRSSETKTRASKGTAQNALKAYEYMPLEKLEPTSRVNICGAVKYFKPVCHTRGTDFCSSFAIVDQTLPDVAISCIFFNKDKSRLPEFYRVGDIVLLRRVKINMYRNEPQALGQSYSSFHIFDGRCDQPLDPLKSSLNASLAAGEKEIVHNLRKWSSKVECLVPRTQLCVLKDVVRDTYFDLVAQVVAVFQHVSSKCLCLALCDGTVLPYPMSKVTSEYMPVVSDKDLLKKYSHFVVDVKIYDTFTAQLSDIVPGDYIHLRNIHSSVVHSVLEDGAKISMVELVIYRNVHKGILYSHLHEKDSDVVALKNRLESAAPSSSIDKSTHPMAVSCLRSFATLCLHPNQPFSSLEDILISTKMPNIFRCCVQPDAIRPGNICDLVQLRCPKCLYKPKETSTQTEQLPPEPGGSCPVCAEQQPIGSSQLQHMYVFVLDLVDDTGSLEAQIVEGGSGYFLQNLAPTDLRTNTASRDEVLKRLHRLFNCDPFNATAMRETIGTRPYMDCCLMAYYSLGMPKSTEEAKSAHVSYRMYDTIILDED